MNNIYVWREGKTWSVWYVSKQGRPTTKSGLAEKDSALGFARNLLLVMGNRQVVEGRPQVAA